MTGEQHVKASAALRGQGKYAEAIAEIENNMSAFDDISLVPALIQALYAAKDAGDTSKVREIAQQIARHDPDVPSIQEFLA